MLNTIVNTALGMVGFRLVRNQSINRFDAMSPTLRHLALRGYRPRIVLDCGANLGQWATTAMAVFEDAEFHLVEPQQNCHAVLRSLTDRKPRLHLHRFALTQPGVRTVQMAGGGPLGTSSGSWVHPTPESEDDIECCPATTLDELFEDRVNSSDRCLLKMDMEGHELIAFSGAERLLARVEAILIETWFIDLDTSAPHGLFRDMFHFLNSRDFELYDIASMNGRRRDGRLRSGDLVFVQRTSELFDGALK